jgi:alkylation response protein AidB-like acyl-CoA dehydrogenase
MKKARKCPLVSLRYTGMRKIPYKRDYLLFRETFKAFLSTALKDGDKASMSSGISSDLVVVASRTEMARLITYNAAYRITYEAVQIHSGYGYMAEIHIERLYRDARALELFLEPCQIQGNMIADQIAGGIIPNP